MGSSFLSGSINPKNIFSVIKYKRDFHKKNPTYFNPCGVLVFSGAQGQGKTLSMVQYITKILNTYNRAILVSNITLRDFPFNTYYKIKNTNENTTIISFYSIYTNDLLKVVTIIEEKGQSRSYIDDKVKIDFPLVIEYTGLDCLTEISNGIEGVIFLIDEFHLEMNSLESKNISIDKMTEISQLRKQRKHIVCSSQVFLRLAKPLREQIHELVICKNYLDCIQVNKYLLGETISEENGKIKGESSHTYIWFHTPNLYNSYDTYAKMKRYSKEWKGERIENIYGGVSNE